MILTGHQSLPLQLKLRAVFYLLIWFIKLEPARPETCAPVSKSLRFQVGNPTGAQCTVMAGGVADCTLRCAARSSCRLVYYTGNQCHYCDWVMGVTFGDYPTPPQYFFLYTRQSAQNTGTVSLYGGLVAGEPVMVDLELAITIVSLNFLDATFNTALKVEFQEDKQKVVVSSRVNGVQNPENDYTADYNFQLGHIASVLFVVTTTDYIVYVDQ
ncbi:hypothetical protein ElyMa_001937200, partial [Elysia marginata]